eukprot:213117-Amphidinium_carterae.1
MAKTEKDEPDTSELEETVEATLETSPLPHAPLDEVAANTLVPQRDRKQRVVMGCMMYLGIPFGYIGP